MRTEEFISVRMFDCEIAALLQTEPNQKEELFQLCYETALRLSEQKSKALEIASQITNENQRNVVVTWLSCSDKTFDDISEEMCYTLRHISRLFKGGISELESAGLLVA